MGNNRRYYKYQVKNQKFINFLFLYFDLFLRLFFSLLPLFHSQSPHFYSMYPTSLPDCGSFVELSSQQDSPSNSSSSFIIKYSLGSLPKFPYQSAIATSLDFDVHTTQRPKKDTVSYEASKVILFKGIPEDMVEAEILNLCEVFGIIKDIFLKKEKRYAFVQFDVTYSFLPIS